MVLLTIMLPLKPRSIIERTLRLGNAFIAAWGKGLRARPDSSKTPSVAGALVASLSFDRMTGKMRVCARNRIGLAGRTGTHRCRETCLSGSR